MRTTICIINPVACSKFSTAIANRGVMTRQLGVKTEQLTLLSLAAPPYRTSSGLTMSPRAQTRMVKLAQRREQDTRVRAPIMVLDKRASRVRLAWARVSSESICFIFPKYHLLPRCASLVNRTPWKASSKVSTIMGVVNLETYQITPQ